MKLPLVEDHFLENENIASLWQSLGSNLKL